MKLPGLQGAELVEGWHVTTENVATIKSELDRSGLKFSSIIPNNFGEAH